MPLLPLLGHEALRERLRRAFERGALPQSLLLHGEEGIGKQRLALWLGQLLLCEGTDKPCGACPQCRYSAELSHPDLVWVFPRERLKDSDPSLVDIKNDVAQGTQERMKTSGLYAPPSGSDGLYVATTRLLVHLASVTPAMARRKVFVVGQAERMVPQESAKEAANAFLKLLEEPPHDTFIILTSSAPGALLPTIRSRVVSLRMAPLSDGEVEKWLADPVVVKSLEKQDLPAALDERVRLAAGAPGRLLGSIASSAAAETAERILEVALSGDRGRLLKAALAQKPAGARGGFSDVLEALSIALHRRSRQAVERDDEVTARNAARAMDLVEASKAMAGGNVNPQLITASLLHELTRVLAS
ncbi:MAG: hypothetical protein ABIZ91_04620 [Gemmatimonadaceae bacterium]